MLSEYEIRRNKVITLRDLGINPFAQQRKKTHHISEILSPGGIEGTSQSNIPFRPIENILTGPKTDISIAGRLMLKRVSGKLSFGQIQDESGMIQVMREHQNSKIIDCFVPRSDGHCEVAKANEAIHTKRQALLGESTKPFDYRFVDKFLDVGDWIGIRGELFVTHKGELTLFVSEYQLLSKAIRPLGDKFHGIGEGQETAYRQRYLDMIFNRDTLERMKLRSQFIRTLREFYRKHDFIEIDCPVLTPSASGAAAKPFATYHNDFDREFYLRICNETELKKATVGGLEKVFTIATNFRNEGSDPSHLQEFMMLEHQAVFKSFHEDMEFTQQMFDYVFDRLELNRIFEVKDKIGNVKTVDFTTPWPKIDYVEGINKASGLNVTSYTIDDADRLRYDIRAKGIEFEGMEQMGTMTLIDYLYKKVLRPTITGPAFIYNYPSIIAPLARITDEDPNKCEKRQVVVNGREIINSYGELIDPIRQKANFDEQSKAEQDGDAEATSSDLEFVKAMEYGMPIQAGFGMGIDRVIALITQQDNLRDVVMFPLMKPESSNNIENKSIEQLKIAVALMNEEIKLLPRQEMNAIAHLNAAFGGRIGSGLFTQDTIETLDKKTIKLNIKHPILIKTIKDSKTIKDLLVKARELGLEASEFTKEMLEESNDNKLIITTKEKKHNEIEYLGILIFGEKNIIEKLTKDYKLYS